jgi:hypothetical protein
VGDIRLKPTRLNPAKNRAAFVKSIVHDRIILTGHLEHSDNVSLAIYDLTGKSILLKNLF